MAWGLVAVAGGTVLGGMMAADAQESAAATAAGAQSRASELQIEEQRRQFDAMRELLSPYVEAGGPALQQMAGYADIGPQALEQQMALAGLRGAAEQEKAIGAIEQSPLYQAQVRQGEEAILQQASATGGLRGGNVQAALAQFRPQMLSQAIEQQYGRLGGLTNFGASATGNLAQIGQSSAAGQAAAGMDMASSVGQALQGAGQAQAQAALSSGAAQAGMWGNIANTASTLGTLQMLGKFPGTTAAAAQPYYRNF